MGAGYGGDDDWLPLKGEYSRDNHAASAPDGEKTAISALERKLDDHVGFGYISLVDDDHG